MFKKMLIFVGSFFALLLLLGLVVLPKEMSIDQEIIINKPKHVVFGALISLKNDDWTVWQKKDPKIQMEFKGTDGNVGSIASWKGNEDVGIGEQEIKKIIDGERVETELRFKEPMSATNFSTFTTESLEINQTKVKWNFSGPNPFPMNVMFFILNMKGKMKEDMQHGLENLKKKLESAT